jgi:hypothetical protein
MPQSQEASDVPGDEEGRKRGRSSGTQLSSFSHLERSDDQTPMLKGLVAIAKSSVAWKAQLSEGVNRGCGSTNAFMCQCGFSAAARLSSGIR